MLYASQRLGIAKCGADGRRLVVSKLTKLPQLPKQNGDITFEWPQADELQRSMAGQEVKLTKIEIWRDGNGNCVSGVRLTLSNNMQSPAFKTSGN